MIKLNIQRFSSTNKTTHYELSQYVSSDLPTYLVDYNGDMSKIDSAINIAQTTADTASTAAINAATAAEGAQSTANTAVTNAATADTKATTANANIGILANLTTLEKTNLVGAINEVNAKEYIVNAQSTATNKAYSADFSDSRYKLKSSHAETTIWTGNVSGGTTITLANGKTWEDYGKFSELILELRNNDNNYYSTAVFNFDTVATGSNLNDSKRNVNAAALFVHSNTECRAVTLIPATDIGSNTIKFTLPTGNYSILSMDILD